MTSRPPLAELLHLALLLAHHHRHAVSRIQSRPAPQEDRLLLVRRLHPLRFQRLDTFLPVALDQPEHPHAGHLVDAHQHRLAGLPGRGVVPHEVPRHLVEPPPGGDDVVVALELPFQALRHVDTADGRFELLQLLGDALVQVPDRHPQRVAAGVVVEGYGGLVLHRALEVVGRDVVAEHLPRELVAGEQRRAGKADVAGVRQGVAHVQRQRAVLGTVRLVGDDDDVVARGAALAGHDVPVEFLDQREDVRLVLRQQPAQVLSARGPAGVAVVVHHPAAGEGLIDLAVEVVAVGQHQEGEVAAELAMHLAGEQHHRIALAGPLGMPEKRPAGPAAACVRAPPRRPRFTPRNWWLRARIFFGSPEESSKTMKFSTRSMKLRLPHTPFSNRFHIDHAGLLLGQALPFVEVLPAAGDGADLRLLAVAEHHHRVVWKTWGTVVAVVRVVALEGGLQVAMEVLALDEEQRQAVDEADEVRPAAVEVRRVPTARARRGSGCSPASRSPGRGAVPAPARPGRYGR